MLLVGKKLTGSRFRFSKTTADAACGKSHCSGGDGAAVSSLTAGRWRWCSGPSSNCSIQFPLLHCPVGRAANAPYLSRAWPGRYAVLWSLQAHLSHCTGGWWNPGGLAMLSVEPHGGRKHWYRGPGLSSRLLLEQPKKLNPV